MDREQIIKALECCTHIGTGGLVDCVCDECPYCIGKDDCRNLDAYALSLIKELTEENERLRGERDVRDTLNKDLMFRNEDLQKANKDLGEYCIELQDELNTCIDIKADTVEKIKLMFAMRFGTYTDKDMTPIKEVFALLDKFEKEMFEDAE